jgi:hypothetical protein
MHRLPERNRRQMHLNHAIEVSYGARWQPWDCDARRFSIRKRARALTAAWEFLIVDKCSRVTAEMI